MLLGEGGEDPGDQVGEGVGHPQPQSLLCGVGKILHGVLCLRAQPQDPLGPDHELLALIGKGHLFGVAYDQLGAQLRLQSADGAGDGRLGDIEGLAGLGEILILIYRVEILEVPQIEHCRTRLSGIFLTKE